MTQHKLGTLRKAVSFNLDRADERALFEFAATLPSFSRRVKQYLAADLRAAQQSATTQRNTAQEV